MIFDIYLQFDAIVADPPYGKRERARTSKSSSAVIESLESKDAASDVLQTLLRVATHRLKSGGRLVFWYPSEQGVSSDEIKKQLQDLILKTHVVDPVGEDRPVLSVLSVGKEELSTMWRWLCVMERS
jgi:tRNA G10  N-methylase Trm11